MEGGRKGEGGSEWRMKGGEGSKREREKRERRRGGRRERRMWSKEG